MLSATRQYTGSGLLPAEDVNWALTKSVNLPPGFSGLAGQVLGQFTGSGTAANEVQRLTGSGTISGGTFRLQVADGSLTSPIAYNASAADIQAALVAVLGAGNVTASGGPLPGSTVDVTFQGMCGGLDQPLLVVVSALTGTNPLITPTVVTPGKPAAGYFTYYNDALSDGTQVARCALQYDCVVDQYGKVTFGQQHGGGDFGGKDFSAPAYFRGIFWTSQLIGIDANGVADLGRMLIGTTGQLNSSFSQMLIG